jgi:hypothetical protein
VEPLEVLAGSISSQFIQPGGPLPGNPGHGESATTINFLTRAYWFELTSWQPLLSCVVEVSDYGILTRMINSAPTSTYLYYIDSIYGVLRTHLPP